MSVIAEALAVDLSDLSYKMRLVSAESASPRDLHEADERRLQLEREQWARDHANGIGFAQVVFALVVGAIFVAVGSLFL